MVLRITWTAEDDYGTRKGPLLVELVPSTADAFYG
jgi:hypothetical protein